MYFYLIKLQAILWENSTNNHGLRTKQETETALTDASRENFNAQKRSLGGDCPDINLELKKQSNNGFVHGGLPAKTKNFGIHGQRQVDESFWTFGKEMSMISKHVGGDKNIFAAKLVNKQITSQTTLVSSDFHNSI